MNMLKLLDLFCKAGGCSVGYSQAGYDVVGIDIDPQPNYPYPFIQANALELDQEFLREFDVIHASPPCQAYSIATHTARSNGKVYPDLLAPTRDMLVRTGKPWIIENVVGSPVQSGIMLCGSMFGLRVRRHRYFETSHMIFTPSNCRHTNDFVTIFGGSVTRSKTNPAYTGVRCGVRHYIPTTYPLQDGFEAMGIDWTMTPTELSNAIPPAYTRYVGEQYLLLFKTGT